VNPSIAEIRQVINGFTADEQKIVNELALQLIEAYKKAGPVLGGAAFCLASAVFMEASAQLKIQLKPEKKPKH
jgi:hypothetical protein